MESSPIHPWWTSKEGWWQGPCHLRRGSVKSCQAGEANPWSSTLDIFETSFAIKTLAVSSSFWIRWLVKWHRLENFWVTGHYAMAEFWWLLWCMEISQWFDAVLEGCRIQVGFSKTPKFHIDSYVKTDSSYMMQCVYGWHSECLGIRFSLVGSIFWIFWCWWTCCCI